MCSMQATAGHRIRTSNTSLTDSMANPTSVERTPVPRSQVVITYSRPPEIVPLQLNGRSVSYKETSASVEIADFVPSPSQKGSKSERKYPASPPLFPRKIKPRPLPFDLLLPSGIHSESPISITPGSGDESSGTPDTPEIPVCLGEHMELAWQELTKTELDPGCFRKRLQCQRVLKTLTDRKGEMSDTQKVDLTRLTKGWNEFNMAEAQGTNEKGGRNTGKRRSRPSLSVLFSQFINKT